MRVKIADIVRLQASSFIVKTCIRTYPGNPDDPGECWHEPLTRLPRIDVVRPIVSLAHQQVHGTTNLVISPCSLVNRWAAQPSSSTASTAECRWKCYTECISITVCDFVKLTHTWIYISHPINMLRRMWTQGVRMSLCSRCTPALPKSCGD